MLSQLRDFFFTYFPFVVAFPFLYSLRYLYSNPPAFRIICYYLFWVCAIQAASFHLWKARTNNLPLLHLYVFIEILLLSLFYCHVLGRHYPRRLFIMITGGVLTLALLNTLFVQHIFHFNTYTKAIESLLFICLSFAWYNKMILDPGTDTAYTNAVTWMVTGFLIYFTGSLLLFVFSSQLMTLEKKLRLIAWNINTVLSVILYLLLWAGLWTHRKR
jgi:hypothetical protein